MSNQADRPARSNKSHSFYREKIGLLTNDRNNVKGLGHGLISSWHIMLGASLTSSLPHQEAGQSRGIPVKSDGDLVPLTSAALATGMQ